jgi:hypothetical protein
MRKGLEVSAAVRRVQADCLCRFEDAGAAPLTLLDTSSQRAPATLFASSDLSDAAASLGVVKQRSEGKETPNGS